MRIKNVRTAKNVVACLVAVDLFAMGTFLPPFKVEEEYTFNGYENNMEYSSTRKLVKKNDFRNYDTTYRRNARNSLGKANYYTETKDF